MRWTLRAAVGSSASLAAALAMWWPAFRSREATGFGDWQQFHHAWEAGWVALHRFGEWPLWDPFHCGGITIFGNPQSQHFSPLYFLSFLFGPTLATKLFLLLHAAAGFGGMYAFARREHALGRASAMCASLAWAGSGFFAWHGAGGHSAFLPFYLTPCVLLAWRRASEDVRWTTAVAALMALVLCEGGVYPFPYLVVICGFDALARFARSERREGIVVAGVVAAPLTALLGAVRILPIADELRRHPRAMPSRDGVSLREVVEMLTAREHAWRNGAHEFVWPEYGTFVGWGVIALGAVGVLVAARRGRWSVPLGLALFGAFMAGDHGRWWPWPLLHALPVYDSLRVPSRFAVFFTLYLALAAGLALDAALDRARTLGAHRAVAMTASALAYAIVLGLASDLYVVNHRTIDRWNREPVADGPVAPRHYLSNLSYGRWYASFPRLNVGSRGCYEAMNFTVPKGLWTGDVAQARIERAPGETSSRGEVRDWGRTTSSAWADVALFAPSRVVFNQGWAPGWTSSVGVARSDPSGRLVVDAPAGTHRIRLVYKPPTLPWALASSIVGLAGVFGVACFPSRFSRKAKDRPAVGREAA